MSTDSLIPILEEIRDQQKRQIANFERALAAQDKAMDLQQRGRRTLMFVIFMPWLLLLGLLIVLGPMRLL